MPSAIAVAMTSRIARRAGWWSRHRMADVEVEGGPGEAAVGEHDQDVAAVYLAAGAVEDLEVRGADRRPLPAGPRSRTANSKSLWWRLSRYSTA